MKCAALNDCAMRQSGSESWASNTACSEPAESNYKWNKVQYSSSDYVHASRCFYGSSISILLLLSRIGGEDVPQRKR